MVHIGYRSVQQMGATVRAGPTRWPVAGWHWAAGAQVGREPTSLVWLLPSTQRGRGYGPRGPMDTPIHEVGIHAYRLLAGMESQHAGHVEGAQPGERASDNDVDRETHYFWNADYGTPPPLHSHPGADAPPSDEHLAGPVVDSQGRARPVASQ
jgi:hypothetical protein